jgi:hypothetical protein
LTFSKQCIGVMHYATQYSPPPFPNFYSPHFLV